MIKPCRFCRLNDHKDYKCKLARCESCKARRRKVGYCTCGKVVCLGCIASRHKIIVCKLCISQKRGRRQSF